MAKSEKIPPLAGIKEACEIMGWDFATQRTMVHTYMKRGKFPEPIQRLSYGPVWTVKQLEEYRDRKNK